MGVPNSLRAISVSCRTRDPKRLAQTFLGAVQANVGRGFRFVQLAMALRWIRRYGREKLWAQQEW